MINPDPIMEKLGEMYPGIHVEHWWADEDVGSNTGHRVMFDGGVVENRFDGDSDAYSIYTMLWGESKCVYLDDSGLIHFQGLRHLRWVRLRGGRDSVKEEFEVKD